MKNWFDISYLAEGSSTQRLAYETLKRLDILEALADYHPVLAGTIPLDLALNDSDLDILCEAHHLLTFDRKVQRLFGNQPGFTSTRKIIKGMRTSIHRFSSEHFPIEVFGQPQPVEEQQAFRHMRIEARLLEMGGEASRKEILALKKSGMKTEPAFARYFGLEGHPALSLED